MDTYICSTFKKVCNCYLVLSYSIYREIDKLFTKDIYSLTAIKSNGFNLPAVAPLRRT